jgi:ABC-type Mn2+/Zn2+ transport system permease subunit
MIIFFSVFLIPVIIFVFIIVIIFRKKLYLNIFNENHQKWLNTLKVVLSFLLRINSLF